MSSIRTQIRDTLAFRCYGYGSYDGMRSELQEQIDQATDAILKLISEEVIGEDVAIFVDGKQVKHGDPMEINFQDGVGSKSFRESCLAIQENGRNLEKAEQREKLK